jgi:hypothetical protein
VWLKKIDYKREPHFPLQTQTRYSISTKPTRGGVSISLLPHTPFLSFAVYTTEISTAQQTREKEKNTSLSAGGGGASLASPSWRRLFLSFPTD